MAQAREVRNLDFRWEFSRGDSCWQMVDLPHDFQISQPWVVPSLDEKANNTDNAANVKSRLSARAFKEMGRGYYRKELTIEKDLQGKRILLDFGGIILVGDVYLNGERIGGTDYGYLGFDIDVSSKLKYGETNLIEVIADTGETNNSRWYTGGGLYRDVNLIITNPQTYVARHGVYITTDNITEHSADVNIMTEVVSKTKASELVADIQIIDATGRCVEHSEQLVAVNRKQRDREYQLRPIHVANPNLWDCDTPYIYTAIITIKSVEGEELDQVTKHFGIRSIEYSPDFGLKLNGKKVLLKGIANHHTLGSLGAAAYPAAIEKRVKLLKSFGFNHIRTSHNPYSEDFLDICDKYGMLVVDELYDKWLKQYAGGRKEWSELWQTDVPEFVKRDRNHPCVVMWSLGNELQLYSNLPFNDWGVTAYKLQKVLLNRYDKTRPVTVAMHPRGRSLDTDSIPAPLALETDIAAYNYRYMYFPGDARRYPDKIFYQSEASLSAMGPNFFEPNNNKVVGLAYWGMIDYLGESLGWPAKGWVDGVFDITLNPKPKAYLLKSMFTDEPTVHLAIDCGSRIINWNDEPIGGAQLLDNWNITSPDPLTVYTYTNADEVELRVNGHSYGRKHNPLDDTKQRNQIRWDSITYAPGKIEAIAYTDGKVVAKHELQTASQPVKLIAKTDNSAWRADGFDLQTIDIYAVDKNGRQVPYADDELTFELSGNASLIAVGNGDMCSDELHVANYRSLYNGHAQVILRSSTETGEVTLTIKSHKYKTIKLNLKTIL
jgi:beta-galactosidase